MNRLNKLCMLHELKDTTSTGWYLHPDTIFKNTFGKEEVAMNIKDIGLMIGVKEAIRCRQLQSKPSKVYWNGNKVIYTTPEIICKFIKESLHKSFREGLTEKGVDIE